MVWLVKLKLCEEKIGEQERGGDLTGFGAIGNFSGTHWFTGTASCHTSQQNNGSNLEVTDKAGPSAGSPCPTTSGEFGPFLHSLGLSQPSQNLTYLRYRAEKHELRMRCAGTCKLLDLIEPWICC